MALPAVSTGLEDPARCPAAGAKNRAPPTQRHKVRCCKNSQEARRYQQVAVKGLSSLEVDLEGGLKSGGSSDPSDNSSLLFKFYFLIVWGWVCAH